MEHGIDGDIDVGTTRSIDGDIERGTAHSIDGGIKRGTARGIDDDMEGGYGAWNQWYHGARTRSMESMERWNEVLLRMALMETW